MSHWHLAPGYLFLRWGLALLPGLELKILLLQLPGITGPSKCYSSKGSLFCLFHSCVPSA
jgi:hypothetical protein